VNAYQKDATFAKAQSIQIHPAKAQFKVLRAIRIILLRTFVTVRIAIAKEFQTKVTTIVIQKINIFALFVVK